ncbi:hypothetical protein [Paenibacillus oleatilyticus]|uniref:Uncharacterized protein n=1 Tax=Paenibacillus oleatilyticus TaxID=2594886 RepID=A0ABV4VBB8_9BACL
MVIHFTEHGAKKTSNQLIDRAKSKEHQIGQWLDEQSAADFLAEIAKKRRGVRGVPLPGTLKTRSFLPDGTELEPDMARVVVKMAASKQRIPLTVPTLQQKENKVEETMRVLEAEIWGTHIHSILLMQQ